MPRRATECWCGYTQAQADRHAAQQARANAGLPRELKGLLVLLGLIVVLGLAQVTRHEAPASSEQGLPRPASAPRLPPTSLAPIAGPDFAPAATVPAPRPLRIPPAEPSPAIAPVQANVEAAKPAPAALGETDTLRQEGARAFEAAIDRLARRAQALATDLKQYEDNCQGRRVGFMVAGNCPQFGAEAARLAMEIQAGIDEAEDQARRSWVQPGEMRLLRKQHHLDSDEWDALARAARNLKR